MHQLSYKHVIVGAVLMTAPMSIGFASDPSSTMVTTEVSVVEGDILSGPRMHDRGIGVTESSAVWPDGIVPYYIDPRLQKRTKQTVQSAVDTWNTVSGVTLVSIDPEAKSAPEDYLHFTPAQSCASWVGRQGGVQAVWTGDHCLHGNMVHEIGHALGLEHEHTRPDRDQHINIIWDNIADDKIDNFAIRDLGTKNHGPYDYDSIMHYGNYFFSKNGKQTIKPIGDESIKIGQRLAPSSGDINAIAQIYKTDLSLVSHIEADLEQTEVSLLITNNHFQGANMLELTMNVGEAQLLSNSNTDWYCIMLNNELNCSRDRLPGNSQSSLVLAFDQKLDASELNPALNSKTPDINLDNNSGEFSSEAAVNENQPSQATPLSDESVQASAGAMGYTLGGVFLMLAMRRLQTGPAACG